MCVPPVISGTLPDSEHVIPCDLGASGLIAVVCAIGKAVAHPGRLDAAAPEAALEAPSVARVLPAAGLVLAGRALPLAVAPHARGQAAALRDAGEVRLGTAPVALAVVGRATSLILRARAVVLEVAEGIGGDAVAGGAPPLCLGAHVAL